MDKTITFFQNLINVILSPINELIIKLFPNYNIVIPIINEFFYNISNPINFLIDATFISSLTWNYLITTIIFRVTIKMSTYLIKNALKWWDTIFA